MVASDGGSFSTEVLPDPEGAEMVVELEHHQVLVTADGHAMVIATSIDWSRLELTHYDDDGEVVESVVVGEWMHHRYTAADGWTTSGPCETTVRWTPRAVTTSWLGGETLHEELLDDDAGLWSRTLFSDDGIHVASNFTMVADTNFHFDDARAYEGVELVARRTPRGWEFVGEPIPELAEVLDAHEH